MILISNQTVVINPAYAELNLCNVGNYITCPSPMGTKYKRNCDKIK